MITDDKHGGTHVELEPSLRGDPDHYAIISRRNLLVAVAMSGVTGLPSCGGKLADSSNASSEGDAFTTIVQGGAASSNPVSTGGVHSSRAEAPTSTTPRGSGGVTNRGVGGRSFGGAPAPGGSGGSDQTGHAQGGTRHTLQGGLGGAIQGGNTQAGARSSVASAGTTFVWSGIGGLNLNGGAPGVGGTSLGPGCQGGMCQGCT